MIDTLNSVALFRAQAKLANRRVEELGSDLDSALSLLDVRQSRGPQTVGTSKTTGELPSVLP